MGNFQQQALYVHLKLAKVNDDERLNMIEIDMIFNTKMRTLDMKFDVDKCYIPVLS